MVFFDLKKPFSLGARCYFVIVAVVLIFAVGSPAKAQVPFPEFLVNTTTSDSQVYPAIADDAQGRFVIAWTSNGQDGDGLGVYARLFDARGRPRTGEIRINTYTAGAQFNPSVAMADGGRFVVVWESAYQDGYSYGIYGRRFNSDGIAMGSEFHVNMENHQHQQRPDVACDAYGDFTVVWDSNGQDGSGKGVYGRLYDRNGNVLATSFRSTLIPVTINRTRPSAWTGEVISSSYGVPTTRTEAAPAFTAGDSTIRAIP